MQSYCHTPTVWLIFSSTFPTFRTILRSLYILDMADLSFGGSEEMFAFHNHYDGKSEGEYRK